MPYNREPKKTIRFMAVGDMMFCCELGKKIRSMNNYDYHFDKIRHFLNSADFLYGNLETMITSERRYEGFAAPGLYYTDPPVSICLANANFKAVSLAHNHLYDFGSEAVGLTIRLLEREGIKYHGVGQDYNLARIPLEFEINGLKFGMVNYCNASTAIDLKHRYVACPIKSEIIKQDVTALATKVDFVIVTLHDGTCSYPSPKQREWSKLAIDCGAKLVIGHHSHLINGIEEYKDGLIAYGLGDFLAWFDDKKSRNSFILDCIFNSDGTMEYQAVPVWLNEDFQIELAEGAKKDEINSELKILNEKLRLGKSDDEYWKQMKKSFLGTQYRDFMRSFRGEGVAAIIRKFKKIRLSHVKLLINSIFRSS
jgi:poly-gamma-glutamate synthesis protein (capsule biosynthesis protein)